MSEPTPQQRRAVEARGNVLVAAGANDQLLFEFGSSLRQTAAVKTTTKRRTKSEAQLLDHATENLLRGLKREMLEKDGRVDREKLRKDGYSDRLIAKLEAS
jgi:hypothetical protein